MRAGNQEVGDIDGIAIAVGLEVEVLDGKEDMSAVMIGVGIGSADIGGIMRIGIESESGIGIGIDGVIDIGLGLGNIAGSGPALGLGVGMGMDLALRGEMDTVVLNAVTHQLSGGGTPKAGGSESMSGGADTIP